MKMIIGSTRRAFRRWLKTRPGQGCSREEARAWHQNRTDLKRQATIQYWQDCGHLTATEQLHLPL